MCNNDEKQHDGPVPGTTYPGDGAYESGDEFGMRMGVKPSWVTASEESEQEE